MTPNEGMAEFEMAVAREVQRRREERVQFMKRLFAYLFMILLMAGLYWRQEQTINRIEHESILRSYENCINGNQARAGIQKFVGLVVLQDGSVTPTERAALDLSKEKFALRPCPPLPSDRK